jgi:hypothetical protein
MSMIIGNVANPAPDVGAQNYDLWKITCFDGSNIFYIRLYLTF